MPNPYFRFKQFTVYHDRCAMKVTTDSCFFGAWVAKEIKSSSPDSYREKFGNVLDLGTGTGLLSLMVAQSNEVEVEAIEIDEEASEQAKENVAASSWENRIKVFNQDIRSFYPEKKYDYIICNPPFYENELTSGIVKKNIAHHSEQLSIADVLKFIQTYLNEDGLFFLMYSFKRKKEVDDLLRQNDLSITDSVLLTQSVEHPPFRVVVKGNKKKTITKDPLQISIWDEKQQYTESFINLLKDYYLYL